MSVKNPDTPAARQGHVRSVLVTDLYPSESIRLSGRGGFSGSARPEAASATVADIPDQYPPFNVLSASSARISAIIGLL